MKIVFPVEADGVIDIGFEGRINSQGEGGDTVAAEDVQVVVGQRVDAVLSKRRVKAVVLVAAVFTGLALQHGRAGRVHGHGQRHDTVAAVDGLQALDLRKRARRIGVEFEIVIRIGFAKAECGG